MDRRDDNFRNGAFSWFTGEVTKVASDGTNRVKVYPHGYYDVKFKDEKMAGHINLQKGERSELSYLATRIL